MGSYNGAILISISLLGCQSSTEQTESPPSQTKSYADYDPSLVKGYDIVETEDISMKALEKSLSSYTTREIEKLPMNIRKIYRIVVPGDVTKEELKATAIQLVLNKTKMDPDIDEIAIFIYDREEDAEGAYTLGKAEWCPNGEWGVVTSKIASTNDRSSYKFAFNIKDKVGNVDLENKPTAREYEIYDIYNKALWEDPDRPEEEVTTEVAKELGISEEELERIYLKVFTYNMQKYVEQLEFRKEEKHSHKQIPL